jgi:solute:Na+ symporter, SSS family
VLVFGSIIGTSMHLPTVWAIWSKRINGRAVWFTVSASLLAGTVIKFILVPNGPFGSVESFAGIIGFVEANSRAFDVFLGVVTPILVLLICEFKGAKTDPGYVRLQARIAQANAGREKVAASTLPAKVILINLGILSLMLAIMAMLGSDRTKVLWAASGIFLLTMFAGCVPIAVRVIRRTGN